MKTKLDRRAGAAALALAAATAAVAQPYGPGGGMMGDGYGYGMMGGRGAGPMRGYGMGPGMMWGDFDQAYAGIDLSADQRRKIDDIEEQVSKSMWQLMGSMHEQGYQMGHMMGAAPLDEASARKTYEAMAATHKQMFELQLDARKRIDAVLTPQQREQVRRYWGAR